MAYIVPSARYIERDCALAKGKVRIGKSHAIRDHTVLPATLQRKLLPQLQRIFNIYIIYMNQ